MSAGIAARIVYAAPRTFVSTMSRQCSGVSSRKPRLAPKPAFAKTTSMRPKCSSAAATIASCWAKSVTSHCDRDRAVGAAELLGERVELVLRARREHEPVAGLGGAPGGRGADAARGAGDEEDGIGHADSPTLGGRMLYDKARIFVQAGGGGDGCLSFRREAHVPHGGPDGGDGGHGGDVVLVCDDSLRDLQTYKRRAHYKADARRPRRGRPAPRRQRAGARDRACRRARRSTSWDGSTHDLVVPGQRVVVARGGAGGRGNKRFATSTRQAPRLARARACRARRAGSTCA